MITNKLVVINDVKIIPELGGIRGPITTPERLPIELIAKMIHNGRKVYEVNPYNKGERVKLDVTNVRKVIFNPAVNTAVENTPSAPQTRDMAQIVKDARGVQPTNKQNNKNDFKKR